MDIFELQKRFSTQQKCEVFLRRKRWPKGVVCPKCGAKHPYRIKERKVWQCSACRYQFSVTTRTIFHRSRTPLQKWFAAIWLMCNNEKRISAKQLERSLGVTYKTAWRIRIQIRKAMSSRYGCRSKFYGIIGPNETPAYIQEFFSPSISTPFF